MNIIDRIKGEEKVLAGSPTAREGFRLLDKEDKCYYYYLPIIENSAFVSMEIIGDDEGQEVDSSKGVIVLNLQFNMIGWIEKDTVVEPIDLTVTAERKEA